LVSNIFNDAEIAMSSRQDANHQETLQIYIHGTIATPS